MVAADDDGPVVERRVFEEKGFEKGGGGNSVDGFACADKFFDFVGAFEDDEGSGFALRHVHAGLDVGLEVGTFVFVDIAAPELEAFGHGVAGELGLGTDKEEEFPDFGLEDDDEGNETDAHDAAKDLAAEAHVEGFEDAPGNVHDKERPEDADDVGAFQHAVELVNEEGNDEYVEDVNDAYCWKLEHVNSF